jgi:hypothetical protein
LYQQHDGHQLSESPDVIFRIVIQDGQVGLSQIEEMGDAPGSRYSYVQWDEEVHLSVAAAETCYEGLRRRAVEDNTVAKAPFHQDSIIKAERSNIDPRDHSSFEQGPISVITYLRWGFEKTVAASFWSKETLPVFYREDVICNYIDA